MGARTTNLVVDKSQLIQKGYEIFNDYTQWLQTPSISAHDLQAHLCRVNHFLVFLSTEYSGSNSIFSNHYRRDDAVRAYKEHLRTKLKAQVSSINASLKSLDYFFRFVGMPPLNVDPNPEVQIKALSDADLWRYMNAVRDWSCNRDQAISVILLNTGVTADFISSLTLRDIKITTAQGFILKQGFTQVDLNAECRIAIRDYLSERAQSYPFNHISAFLIDERGRPLSAAQIDLSVRKIGRAVGLDISARHMLATYQYALAKQRNQSLLAQELLAGTCGK